MELPAVDDIDVSRDSLAELCVKPLVSCELWSGAVLRANHRLPAMVLGLFVSFIDDLCVRRKSHHDYAVVIIAVS